MFGGGEHDVGVLLGEDSGIVDIECDSPEAEAELQRYLPEGFKTPCFRSTRGVHRLFRWQRGLPATAVRKVGAIEARLGNKPAQTVLPSALNGRMWINPPGSCPVAELPQGLFRAIQAADKPKAPATVYTPPVNLDRRKILDRAIEYAKTLDISVSGEGGNAKLWSACLKAVNGFVLDDSEAMQALTAWNASCEPPWDEETLLRNIQRARGQGEVGRMLQVADQGEQWGPDSPGYDLAMRVGATVEPLAAVKPPTRYKIRDISHEDFANADFSINYLCDQIIVEGQPFIVAGPQKCLKTSITLDLIFSLATGTPFLGRFAVPSAVPVGIISGESGGGTLQQTMREIARARGRSMTPAPIRWGFDLPQLSCREHLEALTDWIDEHKLRVAAIDPAYLALLVGTVNKSASNLFDMGSVLIGLTEVGRKTGCTIGLIHHFRKSSQSDRYSRPGLEDMSMSGFAEWARQWLLLARRSAYRSNGIHDLWIVAGGSAGHSGEFSLTVNEGTNLTGREWQVVFDAQTEDAPEIKAAKKAGQRDAAFQRDQDKILAILAKGPSTVRKIRVATSIKDARIIDCAGALMERGLISHSDSLIASNGRTYSGYQIEFAGNIRDGSLVPSGF